MHSFKIRPNAYKTVQKKMLFRGIPIMLIAAGIIYLVAVQSTGDNINDIKGAYNSDSYIDWLPYLIPLVSILIFAGFGFYRGLDKIKKMYNSYELLITDNLISREVVNTPTVSIPLNEVQEIIKHKNGSYVIKGSKANDLFLVPKYIEAPEQLELLLNQIKPIAPKGKAIMQLKLLALISFINFGLMMCVLYFQNKIIVAVTGTLFVVLFIWNLIRIQKSKNIDYRTKKTRWISLVAVLIVIYFMITKLTGSPLF